MNKVTLLNSVYIVPWCTNVDRQYTVKSVCKIHTFPLYYRNKQDIPVLYDGFKLLIVCVKCFSPSDFVDLVQLIDNALEYLAYSYSKVA